MVIYRMQAYSIENCALMDRLGSGPLVGRLGSGVRVSGCFICVVYYVNT